MLSYKNILKGAGMLISFFFFFVLILAIKRSNTSYQYLENDNNDFIYNDRKYSLFLVISIIFFFCNIKIYF